jgi:hypothetical protein
MREIGERSARKQVQAETLALAYKSMQNILLDLVLPNKGETSRTTARLLVDLGLTYL